jgi:arabinofuranosyltransferase
MVSPGISHSMRVVVYVTIFIVLLAGLEFLYGNNEFWDDSFIAMLYARNLARGSGPFFLTLPNQAVSSYAQVEGFSNPLWTLLIAGFYWLPGSVFFWIKLASFLSALVLGLAGVKLLGEIVPRARRATPAWVAFLAALLVVLNPSVFAYTKSGMETVTFTALVLTGLWHTLKTDREPRPRNLTVNVLLWFAVTLTRPEGVLYGATAGLFLFVTLWRIDLRRTLLNWVLPFFLLFTGFLLLRHSLYGEWLPNTFYAKVSVRANGDFRQWAEILKSGVLYTTAFFTERLGLVQLAFVLAGFVWFKSLSRRTLSLVGLIVAANVLFVIAVGGDFWPLYRFFQVTWCLVGVLAVVPVLMVAVGQPLPDFASRRAIRVGRIWSPALAVVLVVVHPFTALLQDSRFYGDLPLFSMERVRETATARHVTPLFLLAKWVKENLPEDAVLAVDQAGQIPYYADREIVDVLGLNDRYLARHPLDLRYLRRRSVTHWLAAVVEPDTKPELLYPGLLQQGDFRSTFCLTRVFEGFDQHHNHYVLALFTRRDRLSHDELHLSQQGDGCQARNLAQMLTRRIPRTMLLPNAVENLVP